MSNEVDHESEVRIKLKQIHDELVLSRTLHNEILNALGNIYQLLDSRPTLHEADGD